MTTQKVTTFYPAPGHARRVAENRYQRDHATRIKAIAAGKIINHTIGEVDNFVRGKLSAFLEDEKSCNAKLERFLVDVDSTGIASQERTSNNSWLRFGAYKPVFTGPFCPVRKKED
jgi:hypothetical protein